MDLPNYRYVASNTERKLHLQAPIQKMKVCIFFLTANIIFYMFLLGLAPRSILSAEKEYLTYNYKRVNWYQKLGGIESRSSFTIQEIWFRVKGSIRYS